MSTNNFKKFLTILALVVVSFNAKAYVGIKPVFSMNSLELTVKANNAVLINLSILANSNETFEIQKSYNNKTFTTVAVLFTEENMPPLQSVKITDKINNENNTTVYYRVVKMNKNTAVKMLSNTIAIK
jgi:hypothetical protein